MIHPIRTSKKFVSSHKTAIIIAGTVVTTAALSVKINNQWNARKWNYEEKFFWESELGQAFIHWLKENETSV